MSRGKINIRFNSKLAAVPHHLRTSRSIVTSNINKAKRTGDTRLTVGEEDGEKYYITQQMKEYCQEVVFGGASRSVEMWAEYCNVTVKRICRWNSSPGVVKYLKILRESRKSQIQNEFDTTLATAVNELAKLLRMDVYTRDKEGEKVINLDLLREKRQLIMSYMKLLQSTGTSDQSILNLIVATNQQVNGQSIPGDMAKLIGSSALKGDTQSIDDELKELAMIEEYVDDVADNSD